MLLMAVALLVPFVDWAQNAEVQFTYDACGNRILKSLQLKKVEENGRNVEDKNVFLSSTTEQMHGTEVDLYPNPTEGRFVVALSDNTHPTMEALLTTTAGVVIERYLFLDMRHEFNLSSQPPGIYILRLILDNETRTWKIIKH